MRPALRDDEYCWFAFDVRHDGDRQGSIELNNEQNGALCAQRHAYWHAHAARRVHHGRWARISLRLRIVRRRISIAIFLDAVIRQKPIAAAFQILNENAGLCLSASRYAMQLSPATRDQPHAWRPDSPRDRLRRSRSSIVGVSTFEALIHRRAVDQLVAKPRSAKRLTSSTFMLAARQSRSRGIPSK